MAYTKKEADRVLDNKMTPLLINWIEEQRKVTKMLMAPQFFHPTHSKRDREVLVQMIENFWDVKVHRVGDDAVTLIFK